MAKPIQHKGIEITLFEQEHDKQNTKMFVSFDLNGTRYKNGTVMSKMADTAEHDAIANKLVTWAKAPRSSL